MEMKDENIDIYDETIMEINFDMISPHLIAYGSLNMGVPTFLKALSPCKSSNYFYYFRFSLSMIQRLYLNFFQHDPEKICISEDIQT